MAATSLEIDAGQVLIAGFDGKEAPKELLQFSSHGQLGGFILFGRNLGTLKEVVELNQGLLRSAHREYPLWIAIDQEGGRVARLKSPVLKLPPMRQLGAIDQPSLTYSAAHLLGRQLRKLGFNLNFAPVLDIDSNSENPVINDRSFSADPQCVTRHGLSFAKGLQQATVCACGKHFPGHGDTDTDSHLALPRIRHDMDRLHQIELYPFRKAVDAMSSIMTAHILVDAIDPELPATLSKKVIQNLLRKQLGFEGLVISDDLEMKAIADSYEVGTAAIHAIDAGCDMLLICSRPDLLFEVHAALTRKAEHDTDFAQKLRRSAKRSLAVRRRYPARPLQTSQDVDREIKAERPETLEALISQMNRSTTSAE